MCSRRVVWPVVTERRCRRRHPAQRIESLEIKVRPFPQRHLRQQPPGVEQDVRVRDPRVERRGRLRQRPAEAREERPAGLRLRGEARRPHPAVVVARPPVAEGHGMDHPVPGEPMVGRGGRDVRVRAVAEQGAAQPVRQPAGNQAIVHVKLVIHGRVVAGQEGGCGHGEPFTGRRGSPRQARYDACGQRLHPGAAQRPDRHQHPVVDGAVQRIKGDLQVDAAAQPAPVHPGAQDALRFFAASTRPWCRRCSRSLARTCCCSARPLLPN